MGFEPTPFSPRLGLEHRSRSSSGSSATSTRGGVRPHSDLCVGQDPFPEGLPRKMVERVGIEPTAPSLQGSVASLVHVSPSGVSEGPTKWSRWRVSTPRLRLGRPVLNPSATPAWSSVPHCSEHAGIRIRTRVFHGARGPSRTRTGHLRTTTAVWRHLHLRTNEVPRVGIEPTPPGYKPGVLPV